MHTLFSRTQIQGTRRKALSRLVGLVEMCDKKYEGRYTFEGREFQILTAVS